MNSIHPGLIYTPMVEEALPSREDLQPVVDMTPMKRGAKPEEVAAASCKHNKRKSFSALISALLGEPVSAQPV
jgi:NAD(P)-dependent dehydrogenase (short-subunit alcohol dehydrogenase family)